MVFVFRGFVDHFLFLKILVYVSGFALDVWFIMDAWTSFSDSQVKWKHRGLPVLLVRKVKEHYFISVSLVPVPGIWNRCSPSRKPPKQIAGRVPPLLPHKSFLNGFLDSYPRCVAVPRHMQGLVGGIMEGFHFHLCEVEYLSAGAALHPEGYNSMILIHARIQPVGFWRKGYFVWVLNADS